MGTKKAKGEAKLWRDAVTLTDEQDSRLTVVASQLKDGRFRTAVTYRVTEGEGKGAKKTSQRAMVAFHETQQFASERKAKLVADAAALGWKAKERKTKAPAFTELPKPKKATPKPIAPVRKTA